MTVTGFTRIRGVPAAGAIAHVTAWSFSTDDKCVAMEIKIEGDEEDEDERSPSPARSSSSLREGCGAPGSSPRAAKSKSRCWPTAKFWSSPVPGSRACLKWATRSRSEAVEREDGVVVAKKIELEDDDEEPYEGIHLMGKITEVAEEYIVIRPVVPFGTVKINLTSETVVNGGPLAVGQCVAVRAKGTGHQQYEAIEITVGDCPAPEATGKLIGRTVD